jgi:hypothetical protein
MGMGMDLNTQKEKRLQPTVPLSLTEAHDPTQAASPEEHPILKLQRTIGNQAVQRLLKARNDAHNEPVQPVGPDVQSQIEEQKEGGEPLPADLQSEMETELGGDLSGVRLHTDSTSADLTKSLGARAFTQGRDIFFAQSVSDWSSPRGLETLTHELTHVAEGRTLSGGVQRDPVDDPNIEMDPPEIEMPPMYLGRWGPNDVNPYYAAAQTYLSRYFEFQRGLAQLLAKMRDYGFRNFQTASSDEYNKKEDSFLLKLFDFALNFIPAAGGLLKTFRVLTAGAVLGDVAGLAKGASEVEGAVKGAQKVGEGVKTAAKVGEESASITEKVVSTTESVKSSIEIGKKTKELGGAESEAQAKGNFSMEVLHNLAELDAQRWTAAWADELKLSALLESHRNSDPTVDLETNIKVILDTLYGPMEIPGEEVIIRAGEIFELELYQDYFVKEKGARHLFVNNSDWGYQSIPDGVLKRISKLNGWDIVEIPSVNVDMPDDTRLKAGMKF